MGTTETKEKKPLIVRISDARNSLGNYPDAEEIANARALLAELSAEVVQGDQMIKAELDSFRERIDRIEAQIEENEKLVKDAADDRKRSEEQSRDQRRTESEESERQAEHARRRAIQRNDPRLKRALTVLTQKFGFDVMTCSAPLEDADLSAVLCEPTSHTGAAMAVANAPIPEGGIKNNTDDVLKKLEKKGFPKSGPLREVTKTLIDSWSGDGAGSGARLAKCSAQIVTYAAAAGLNIEDATVFLFMREAVRAKVASMGSDSGTRPGGQDKGELKTEGPGALRD